AVEDRVPLSLPVKVGQPGTHERRAAFHACIRGCTEDSPQQCRGGCGRAVADLAVSYQPSAFSQTSILQHISKGTDGLKPLPSGISTFRPCIAILPTPPAPFSPAPTVPGDRHHDRRPAALRAAASGLPHEGGA